MKALFRRFVLCFFLLCLGGAFALPPKYLERSYIASDFTLVSEQRSQKEIAQTGGQNNQSLSFCPYTSR